MDPQVVQTILVIGFLILCLGIHEAAHAWMANLCGDSTAKDMGRMTLNPLVHIDPFFTILLPAVLILSGAPAFGGAKPVPVFAPRLRHPTRDMMFVALAGPVSNLILAWLFALALKVLVYKFGMSMDSLAPKVLSDAIFFNLVLAVFNMIPVPPLDGSRVMAYFLPGGLRESYVALERFGMLIVLGLFMTGSFEFVLRSTLDPMWRVVLGPLTGGIW